MKPQNEATKSRRTIYSYIYEFLSLLEETVSLRGSDNYGLTVLGLTDVGALLLQGSKNCTSNGKTSDNEPQGTSAIYHVQSVLSSTILGKSFIPLVLRVVYTLDVSS